MMRKTSPVLIYGGLFLVLGAVGFATGLALRAPMQSTVIEQPTHKLAVRQAAKAEEDTKETAQDYRYGPEINHGSSNIPVNAAQQAIKQANAMAPVKSVARKSYRSRIAGRTGSEMYGH